MGEAFFCERGLRLDELPWDNGFRQQLGTENVRRQACLEIDGLLYTFTEWTSGAFEVEQRITSPRQDVFYSKPGDLLLAVAYVIELTRGKLIR
jgi:hypothetical protein